MPRRAQRPLNRFKTIGRTGRSKGCRDSPGNDGRACGEIRAPIADRSPAGSRICKWGASSVAVGRSRCDRLDPHGRMGPYERAAETRSARPDVLAGRQAGADRSKPGACELSGAGAIAGFGIARHRLLTLSRRRAVLGAARRQTSEHRVGSSARRRRASNIARATDPDAQPREAPGPECSRRTGLMVTRCSETWGRTILRARIRPENVSSTCLCVTAMCIAPATTSRFPPCYGAWAGDIQVYVAKEDVDAVAGVAVSDIVSALRRSDLSRDYQSLRTRAGRGRRRTLHRPGLELARASRRGPLCGRRLHSSGRSRPYDSPSAGKSV